MLFNSYEFIFFFLPATLAGFILICRHSGREGAIVWLVLASLFYYGWWNPAYLGLIISSVLFNFFVGRGISRLPDSRNGPRHLLLTVGIVCNLALLGYFKYMNFFVGNLGNLVGGEFSIGKVVLPLAISFFTFQQIAYLVDAYRRKASEYSFMHYALFVTFFPQLIAGPIVHHAEMMPQFKRDGLLRPRYQNVAVGLTIFAIGLFKKTVLADGVSVYATPVFDAAYNGAALTLFEAWGGALAYTMQIYFDFSGYTDMAIGSARLFGIRLPLNFFSPYKSTSIIEFWRRWHMTLSRFLRECLYIPLGGNRKGSVRRYANLLTTMVLGGLWHGAGWTFVAWGALHGGYLVINHAWHWWCRKTGLDGLRPRAAWRGAAWLITFLAVVVGWVLFRAESFDAAIAILRGMAGLNGVSLPNAIMARLGTDMSSVFTAIGIGVYLGGGKAFVLTYLWIGALLIIALVAPNTAQLMRSYRPTIDIYASETDYAIEPIRRQALAVRWRPTVTWSVMLALTAGFGVLALSSVSEFIYFQF